MNFTLKRRIQALQPHLAGLNYAHAVRMLDAGRLRIRDREPNPVRWTA